MNTLPRLTAHLLLFASLALLSGCGGGGGPAAVPVEFMVDVDSPIHDIRLDEFGLVPWAWSDETFSIMPLTQDREGWSYSWRVGGGKILGGAYASTVVWRTPLDTLSWIEATLSRNGESHLCRRWMALSVELQIQDGWQEVGTEVVGARVSGSRRAPSTWHWGIDAGRVAAGENAHIAYCSMMPAGSRRVWLTVDDGLRQASDTLSVLAGDFAPRFWLGESYLGTWPCGQATLLVLHASDLNGDSLGLETLLLPGLRLDSLQVQREPDHPVYQFTWRLHLRDTGRGPGPRSLRLWLTDGMYTIEEEVAGAVFCP